MIALYVIGALFALEALSIVGVWLALHFELVDGNHNEA